MRTHMPRRAHFFCVCVSVCVSCVLISYRSPIVVRNKHNLTLEDEADAVAELARFKAAGGSLVVDATTHGIGRCAHELTHTHT